MNSIEIYDIYDIWYSKSWWENTLVWISVLVFFVCCVGGLLFYFFKKKFKKNEQPTQKALRQLLRLQQDKNTISHQQLYSNLTHLLKEFLCHYYGNYLQGKTDSELLASLHNEINKEDIVDELTSVFQGVELIKFANQQAIITKRDEDLLRTKLIIEKLDHKFSRKSI